MLYARFQLYPGEIGRKGQKCSSPSILCSPQNLSLPEAREWHWTASLKYRWYIKQRSRHTHRHPSLGPYHPALTLQNLCARSNMKSISVLTLLAFLALRAAAAPTDPPPAEGEVPVLRCKPFTNRNICNCELLTLRASKVPMRTGCAHCYRLSKFDELILSHVCRIYVRLDTLAADPCIPRRVECK
jgi:hypothetical protein